MGHNGPAFAIDWHPEEKNWVASAGRDKIIKVAWQCFCLFVGFVFNALGDEIFTGVKFGWLPILCVSCLRKNILQIWDFRLPANPGGHSKHSTQIGSAGVPTPYPFMYHLLTAKVLIPYIDNFVPFHRPTIRDKSS